jgi:hypothetical protein
VQGGATGIRRELARDHLSSAMPRVDLFGPRPRRPRRVLMKVEDAGVPNGADGDSKAARYWLLMKCPKCRHEEQATGTVTESRNMPCPKCNPPPPAT